MAQQAHNIFLHRQRELVNNIEQDLSLSTSWQWQWISLNWTWTWSKWLLSLANLQAWVISFLEQDELLSEFCRIRNALFANSQKWLCLLTWRICPSALCAKTSAFLCDSDLAVVSLLLFSVATLFPWRLWFGFSLLLPMKRLANDGTRLILSSSTN